MVILFAILLIIVYLEKRNTTSEGLTTKPTDKSVDILSKEVVENKNLFKNSSLSNAKRKLPWVDVIIYEDIRKLDNFTIENIKKIIKG